MNPYYIIPYGRIYIIHFKSKNILNKIQYNPTHVFFGIIHVYWSDGSVPFY